MEDNLQRDSTLLIRSESKRDAAMRITLEATLSGHKERDPVEPSLRQRCVHLRKLIS